MTVVQQTMDQVSLPSIQLLVACLSHRDCYDSHPVDDRSGETFCTLIFSVFSPTCVHVFRKEIDLKEQTHLPSISVQSYFPARQSTGCTHDLVFLSLGWCFALRGATRSSRRSTAIVGQCSHRGGNCCIHCCCSCRSVWQELGASDALTRIEQSTRSSVGGTDGFWHGKSYGRCAFNLICVSVPVSACVCRVFVLCVSVFMYWCFHASYAFSSKLLFG